jgi:Xaa-Pro aminopeptidase
MVGRSEDRVVEPGSSMIFDCHGTLDHYCWDGGKTWVVDGQREGEAARIEAAAIESLKTIEAGLKPGARLSELQSAGREVFRRMNVPDPDRSLVFFHGLGLEHVDLEVPSLGRYDLTLEKDMVVSIHVVYPGGSRDRFYIEDNAVTTDDGGKSLYTWGVDPFH